MRRAQFFPAVLFCFLMVGCSKSKKLASMPPVPVEVAAVLQQTVPLDLPFIGAAEALATV